MIIIWFVANTIIPILEYFKEEEKKEEKKSDPDESDPEESDPEESKTKENFSNRDSILKSKKKKIQGYNCGDYSEFTNSQLCPTTSNPNDYIFPGRETNKTGYPKYVTHPRILDYEQDVNRKIVEYESMNVTPEFQNVSQIGKLNVRNRKTPEYKII
jgi:hypothetical protein